MELDRERSMSVALSCCPPFEVCWFVHLGNGSGDAQARARMAEHHYRSMMGDGQWLMIDRGNEEGGGRN
jgi:hypothetical protein